MKELRPSEVVTLTIQEAADLAISCYERKEFSSAWTFLKSIIFDNSNAETLNFAGDILCKLNRYKDALNYLEKASQKEPNNLIYLHSLAMCYMKLGEYVKSERSLLIINKARPQDVNVIDNLIVIYTKQNKFTERNKYIKIKKEIESDMVSYNKHLEEVVNDCEALILNDNVELAKPLLESILSVSDTNVKANSLYASILCSEGKYKEAIFYFERNSGHLYSAHFALVYSFCLLSDDKDNLAVEVLEEARKKYKKNNEIVKSLGLIYFDQREFKKSYKLLDEINNYYSDVPEVTSKRALARYYYLELEPRWFDEERLAPAVRDLLNVHSLQPDNQDVTLAIFKHYNNCGELKKAFCFLNDSIIDDEDLKEFRKTTYYYAIRDISSYNKSFMRGRKLRVGSQYLERLGDKLWQGESLQDKTVLIIREQGIGDELIYAHNYNWIAEQALKVSAVCSPRLISGFNRSFPKVNFIPEMKLDKSVILSNETETIMLEADYIILASEISLWLHEREKIQLYDKFYYKTEKVKEEYWKIKLNSLSNKPKVGIVWRSGFLNMQRSAHFLKINEVAEIVKKIPEVDFVSCMYVNSEREIKEIYKKTSVKIYNFKDLDLKDDFENTAAMLSALDLMVGIYTAPLALAAAVGINIISCGGDYCTETGIIEKNSLNYRDVPHFSLPLLDDSRREEAINEMICKIRSYIYAL